MDGWLGFNGILSKQVAARSCRSLDVESVKSMVRAFVASRVDSVLLLHQRELQVAVCSECCSTPDHLDSY